VRTPRIGDCFEIGLPDGRFAFAQYVFRHDTYGALVRTLSVAPKSLTIADLRFDRLLFPPVFVGLHAAVSKGGWRLIGNAAIEEFPFPAFRHTPSSGPGTFDNWKLWDGNGYTPIGKLSPELRKLEILCVWGYLDLQERIMNGGHSLIGEALT